MSDTGTQKGPDLTGVQRGAGPGLSIGWMCPMCGPKRATLGQRKKQTKWGSLMVCAKCVKEMAK